MAKMTRKQAAARARRQAIAKARARRIALESETEFENTLEENGEDAESIEARRCRARRKALLRSRHRAMLRRAQEEDVEDVEDIDEVDEVEEDEVVEASRFARKVKRIARKIAEECVDEAEEIPASDAADVVEKIVEEVVEDIIEDIEVDAPVEEVEEVVEDAVEDAVDNEVEARRRAAKRARARRAAKRRPASRKPAHRAKRRMQALDEKTTSDDLTGVDGDSSNIEELWSGEEPAPGNLETPNEGDGGTDQTPPDSVDGAEDKVVAAYDLIDMQIAKGVIAGNVRKASLASSYCRKYTAREMRFAALNLRKANSAKKAGKGVRVSRRGGIGSAATKKATGMDSQCLFG